MALVIDNKLSLKNSVPNWHYSSNGSGCSLIFAANFTGRYEEDSAPGNTDTGRPPIMLVEVDPFRKEIINVDGNIAKNNIDAGVNTYISNGKGFKAITLPDGLLTYDVNKPEIGCNVYYLLKNKAKPVFYGSISPSLAYVTKCGIFNRPVISYVPLTGLTYPGVTYYQGQPPQQRKIMVSAASVKGWRNNAEILYSSARLNNKFQYVDMHDLWLVQINGGQTRKLADNAYSPITFPNSTWIVFLRKEENNYFSLCMLGQMDKEEELARFIYKTGNKELPPICSMSMKADFSMDVCYTETNKNGLKSINIVNTSDRKVRTLVKDKNIIGPLVSNYNFGVNEENYLLYFSRENRANKAYVIDDKGKVRSEIYDLLRSAPTKPYTKGLKQ